MKMKQISINGAAITIMPCESQRKNGGMAAEMAVIMKTGKRNGESSSIMAKNNRRNGVAIMANGAGVAISKSWRQRIGVSVSSESVINNG